MNICTLLTICFVSVQLEETCKNIRPRGAQEIGLILMTGNNETTYFLKRVLCSGERECFKILYLEVLCLKLYISVTKPVKQFNNFILQKQAAHFTWYLPSTDSDKRFHYHINKRVCIIFV